MDLDEIKWKFEQWENITNNSLLITCDVRNLLIYNAFLLCFLITPQKRIMWGSMHYSIQNKRYGNHSNCFSFLKDLEYWPKMVLHLSLLLPFWFHICTPTFFRIASLVQCIISTIWSVQPWLALYSKIFWESCNYLFTSMITHFVPQNKLI